MNFIKNIFQKKDKQNKSYMVDVSNEVEEEKLLCIDDSLVSFDIRTNEIGSIMINDNIYYEIDPSGQGCIKLSLSDEEFISIKENGSFSFNGDEYFVILISTIDCRYDRAIRLNAKEINMANYNNSKAKFIKSISATVAVNKISLNEFKFDASTNHDSIILLEPVDYLDKEKALLDKILKSIDAGNIDFNSINELYDSSYDVLNSSEAILNKINSIASKISSKDDIIKANSVVNSVLKCMYSCNSFVSFLFGMPLQLSLIMNVRKRKIFELVVKNCVPGFDSLNSGNNGVDEVYELRLNKNYKDAYDFLNSYKYINHTSKIEPNAFLNNKLLNETISMLSYTNTPEDISEIKGIISLLKGTYSNALYDYISIKIESLEFFNAARNNKLAGFSHDTLGQCKESKKISSQKYIYSGCMFYEKGIIVNLNFEIDYIYNSLIYHNQCKVIDHIIANGNDDDIQSMIIKAFELDDKCFNYMIDKLHNDNKFDISKIATAIESGESKKFAALFMKSIKPEDSFRYAKELSMHSINLYETMYSIYPNYFNSKTEED